MYTTSTRGDFMDEILKAIAQVSSDIKKIDSDIKALDKKIDNVESKLTQEISNVENKLTQEISNVESKLTQKIDSVDTGLRTLIDIDMNTKIQILTDSQVGLIEKVNELPDMDDIDELKADVAVIAAAFKAHVND